MCVRPFVKGIQPYPCGQCMPCRINRRRLWTHRLLLEQKMHDESCFVTLTYAKEPPDGNLVPEHLTAFLKSVRTTCRFRYFAIGEYGKRTLRPHYHVAFYGIGQALADTFAQAWKKGYVHVGELNEKSAAYITGYVTEKMTRKDDPRLNGRHPEFARMSLKPGIGAGAMAVVASALNSSAGMARVAADGDVPAALTHGRKSLPLGRYLRRKLREELGFDHTGGQPKPQAIQAAEMQALLQAAGSRKEFLKTQPYIERQRIIQVETKARIWSKKGVI